MIDGRRVKNDYSAFLSARAAVLAKAAHRACDGRALELSEEPCRLRLVHDGAGLGLQHRGNSESAHAGKLKGARERTEIRFFDGQ